VFVDDNDDNGNDNNGFTGIGIIAGSIGGVIFIVVILLCICKKIICNREQTPVITELNNPSIVNNNLHQAALQMQQISSIPPPPYQTHTIPFPNGNIQQPRFMRGLQKMAKGVKTAGK